VNVRMLLNYVRTRCSDLIQEKWLENTIFGLIRKVLLLGHFMFLFYLLLKQINIEENWASGGPKRQTECMQCCWLNLYPLKILGLNPVGPRTTANISLSLSLSLSDYNLD
jgi:hypothetical protein